MGGEKEKIKRYQQLTKEIELHSGVAEQIKQQLDIIAQEIQSINSVIEDLKYRLRSVEELEVGDGLIKIANGIFAEGVIKDSKKFLINIGHNIFIIKDLESVKKFIKDQKMRVEDVLNKRREEYESLLNSFVVYNKKITGLLNEYNILKKETENV